MEILIINLKAFFMRHSYYSSSYTACSEDNYVTDTGPYTVSMSKLTSYELPTGLKTNIEGFLTVSVIVVQETEQSE